MKKVIGVVMLVAFFMTTLGISFAQEATEAKGSMKYDKEMKKGSMKGRQCSYMKKMMGKEMVSSGDGGVIVLVGNKLIKYDKDLNLTKEVEIEIDTEAMMKKCMEMKKKWCTEMEEDSE